MAQISVYDKSETSYTTNGIILPDVVVCEVEEELNGRYTLELTYPIDEKGKWELLVKENVIKADGQLFRIHRTEKDLDYITVYARHIFYDLLSNFVEDITISNLNGAAALDWLLNGTQYAHPYIGTSDVTSTNTAYIVRQNPVEALLGEDGICERWDAEIERDNFNIRLWQSLGSNKGAQIKFSKNMIGILVEGNIDDVATRLMPIGDDDLMLPEKYVDSPLIGNYAFPRIKTIEMDIGVDDETTEEQAYQQMRDACNLLYSQNKIDIPYESITVDMALLENTEEYKRFSNLIKVGLGDIVSCTDNPLNLSFEAKVVRVRKDVLSGKNQEVEIGKIKKTLTNKLETVIKNISYELQHTKSDFQQAIDNATNLLTSALGGYVLKRAGELLIMDTEDPATATKVWRWNLNGLGYSSNGINGPYELAMTIDGVINADFITAGAISASLVKTGVLSSHDNSIWINLENNTFNFNNALKWENGELIVSGFEGAGSKVFSDTPTTPYNLNDLWKVTGVAGVDFKICTRARATGSYVASDWTNITNSKTYVDAIKNLTTGTAISGGTTTIDNTKVKVSHGSGQYSQLDATGLKRQWLYGAARYLNDIYVVEHHAVIDPYDTPGTPPAPVVIQLPNRFRYRDVEFFVAQTGFTLLASDVDASGNLDWVSGTFESYLNIISQDMTASPPTVTVDNYIETMMYTRVGSSDRQFDFFTDVGFILIAIGK